jgi:hypothetical protein
LATLQGCGDTLRPVDIVGEDGGAQAVFSRIGFLNDLGFGIELCN